MDLIYDIGLKVCPYCESHDFQICEKEVIDEEKGEYYCFECEKVFFKSVNENENKKSNNGYRVTHNGYKVEFIDNLEQVVTYIENVLRTYQDLNPKLIYRAIKTETTGDSQRVLIYQYKTLYSEMFLIESR